MTDDAHTDRVGTEPTPGSGDSLVRDPETDDLVTALLTASRALVGVSARSLTEVEDRLTLSQFRTLVVLTSHGPTRLNLLADRLGVGSSTALRSVDRLIAAGLAERNENPQDRREVVIEVSAAGRHVVEEVSRRRRLVLEEIVSAMPEASRPQVVDALVAFAAAAGEPLATAPVHW